MDKERAIYLLERGFKEGEADVALVHGTSVESTQRLLKNGFLPTNNSTQYAGFMHFTPISEHLKGFPVYNDIQQDLTLNQTERIAALEAQLNERSVKVNKLLGIENIFIKRDAASRDQDLFGILDVCDLDQSHLKEAFRKYGKEALCERWAFKKIFEDLFWRSNGVLIGVNKSYLRRFSPGDITGDAEYNDRDAVKIKTDGLPLEEVQYITPLGDSEERKLENYVQEHLR